MTRLEFARSFAEQYGYSYKSANRLVTELFHHLKNCLMENDKVALPEIGNFVKYKKGPIKKYNFHKKEVQVCKSYEVIAFHPSRAFRDELNNREIMIGTLKERAQKAEKEKEKE